MGGGVKRVLKRELLFRQQQTSYDFRDACKKCAMSYIIYYLELGWLHLSLTFCQSPYQLFKFPSFFVVAYSVFMLLV